MQINRIWCWRCHKRLNAKSRSLSFSPHQKVVRLAASTAAAAAVMHRGVNDPVRGRWSSSHYSSKYARQPPTMQGRRCCERPNRRLSLSLALSCSRRRWEISRVPAAFSGRARGAILARLFSAGREGISPRRGDCCIIRGV